MIKAAAQDFVRRASTGIPFLWCFVLFVGGVFCCPALHAAPAAGADFKLSPSVKAQFDDQGNLILMSQGTNREILRLEVQGRNGRRSVRGDSFFAQTVEGVPGGMRGFSPGSDDDHDVRIDEDPLDGRDNDGDGLIDEDFAAIGDAMMVWDGGGRGAAVHREYYHWANDVLKQTLFFSISSQTTYGSAPSLVLKAGLPWIMTDVSSVRHSVTGHAQSVHTQARITGFPCADGVSPDIWLGFVVLDQGAPDRIKSTDLGQLAAGLGETPLLGAIVVARSWQQLSSRICEAVEVYAGVADPVTGKRAPWIVAPMCSVCRQAPDLECTWRPAGLNGGTLTLNARGSGARFPDLDLLAIDGVALDAPEQITWLGEDGNTQTRTWFRYRFQDLLRGRPVPAPLEEDISPLGTHGHTGRLLLDFAKTPGPLQVAQGDGSLGPPQVLEGWSLGGGRWNSELHIERAEIRDPLAAAPSARKAATALDRDHLALSPRLMLSWPNPFRDRIQIRCHVPASAKEAFASAQETDGFEETAPAPTWDSLPWGDGEPSVSVRIYSLNGQEIRTLYMGRQGPGEFVVQWDGTDSFGRPVASGPYLCKLQLDSLSLTRRLVYIR